MMSAGKKIMALVGFMSVMASSCDEGRIYEDTRIETDDRLVAKFTGHLSGVDSWSDGYTVSIAGFRDGDDYAVITKMVGNAIDDDGKYDVTLSGIPAEVTSIELCVIDRLRLRVSTILKTQVNSAGEGDTVKLSGNFDAGMFNAINTQVFATTCSQCHGGSGYAAAGLWLIPDRSYDALVGIPSSKMDGLDIVSPGHSDKSVLYRALSTTETSVWSYDHSVEVVSAVTLDLIKDWIDGGAKR